MDLSTTTRLTGMVERIRSGEDDDTDAKAVWEQLTSAQREQLEQLLFHGPVWDGNVISKAARGDLFAIGLACRVCFMGQQGYSAATYPAFTVWRQAGRRPLDPRPGSRG